MDIFMNYSKLLENHLKPLKITYNYLNYFNAFWQFFRKFNKGFFKSFEHFFSRYIRMNHSRHENYKNERTEIKYLKYIKNRILKVKSKEKILSKLNASIEMWINLKGSK